MSALNCNKWGRHAIGVFYVLLVVLLWVTSSELTQSIFENKDFNHPFFLTYFSTSLFMIYLPFFVRLIVNQCNSYFNSDSIDKSLYSSLSPTQQSPSNSYSSINASPPNPELSELQSPNTECVEYINKNITNISDDDQTDEPEMQTHSNCACNYDSICIPSLNKLNKLSLAQTLKLSLIFCPIWFLMNYTFNISLNMTSVASNTILSTMSGPFSLLLSKCLLNTKLSFCNSSGVLITLLGAIFIGYLDDKHNNDSKGSVFGDILALLSAFIYACYVTLIKYKIGDENKVNMFLFFAFLGLLNVFMLWPFLIFLDVLKYEMFVWPSNEILLLLTVNGLVSVGSDYFWAQSILYTSAVLATVGLSLMMPVAMIADEIFRNETHSVAYWSGAIFVMSGFILVNLDFKNQLQHQEKVDRQILSLQNT